VALAAARTFTFTAKATVVAPGKGRVAPGTVDLYDGATLLGSVNLTSGSTARLATTLPTGTHTVTAVFSDNAALQPSAPSAVRTVVVS
jgi:hypothetical protein